MLQSFLLFFFLTFIYLDASGLSCTMWDLASCSGVKLWECSLSHWAIREVPQSFLKQTKSEKVYI